MKVMKGLVLLTLFLTIVSVYPASYGEKAKEEPKENASVYITYEKIDEKKPEYEVNMEIPIFHNIQDTFFELKLNHALKKEATDKRTAFITEALKDAKDKEVVRQHQLYEKSLLKMNGEMVSLYTETYLYEGGAHGITKIKTLNFLNGEKVKLLTFADLFKEDSNYKEFLNEKIKKEIEIRKDKGISYFEGEEGFQSVSDDQSFYFEDNHLVVLFDQYMIAPGYVGIPTFTFNLDELQNYLKPEIMEAVQKSFPPEEK